MNSFHQNLYIDLMKEKIYNLNWDKDDERILKSKSQSMGMRRLFHNGLIDYLVISGDNCVFFYKVSKSFILIYSADMNILSEPPCWPI